MRLIDNLRNNHNQSIQSMFTAANQMVLVSPFLTEEFDEIIFDLAALGVKSIVLITTLKDNSQDLFKKSNALYSFCSSCLCNSIKYEVRIDNKLHGKIYIALKDNEPIKGIITSANFTNNGLKHSHEWGVEFDDSEALQSLIGDLMKVSTEPLTYDEIEAVIEAIDEYSKENPPTEEVRFKLNVTKHIESKLVKETHKESNPQHTSFPNDTRFFLKPLGSTEHPFDETRTLGAQYHEMHFSRRRPNAVRPGDILIGYGVGSGKLLGYFRVLSEPYLLPDESTRWPWAVNSDNLCPKYSSKWSSFNKTLSSAQASYGNVNELTHVGGKSLGALNFGADKIRLNEAFAHHLIRIIEQSAIGT